MPPEYAIVLILYEGLGFKAITHKLNYLNLKPKEIQKWQVTSVQTIIRNRIYCGDFVLNRYTTMKVEGKKKQIQNPESPWLIFHDHHEPIIGLAEMFTVVLSKEAMDKLASSTQGWVYFVSEREIEAGVTLDGVKIADVCKTILRPKRNIMVC
jgi:hypothetical protein